MSSNHNSWIKHLDFIILDAVLVEIAYVLATIWRLNLYELKYTEIYQSTALTVVLFGVILDVIFPFLTDVVRRSIYKELRCSAEYAAVLLIALVFYQYMTKVGGLFSRGVFLIFGVTLMAMMFLAHSLYKVILRRHFSRTTHLPRMLIISDVDDIEKNIAQMKRHAMNAYSIVGVATVKADETVGTGDAEIPYIGSTAQLFDYLKDHVVDEVLVAVHDKRAEQTLIQDLLEMGLTIHVNVSMGVEELPNQHVEMIGNRMVVTAANKPFSHGQAALKRLMDIVGGLVGLIFTGIFFVIFAPIIYIQSPGKIFYSQVRVGRNGRRFRMYKFRSMYPDADARKAELMKQNKMDGFMFKMDNDPRIIPIGRFIRKFSIDEFPQFWNVFVGDMSLVGTRPPTEDEWEQYSPKHRARLGMKPGITGLWQVSGRSNITDFDEVVALDVKYIREWSLKNDIKILGKTVKVVVSGEGSE